MRVNSWFECNRREWIMALSGGKVSVGHVENDLALERIGSPRL